MNNNQTTETIRIGKYTVNIIEENQPSEAAIQNTNRKVNETMNKRIAS
jgi:hypothetical protein